MGSALFVNVIVSSVSNFFYMIFRISTLMSMLVLCLQLYAQKPPVDSLTITEWPLIRNAAVSSDGRFEFAFVAKISNMRAASGGDLYIQATDRTRKKVFHGVLDAKFSGDGKHIFWLNSGDSLVVKDLVGDEEEFFPHVSSFQISDQNPTTVAVLLKEYSLVIEDLGKKVSDTILNVQNYGFSLGGRYIYVVQQFGPDHIAKRDLALFDCMKWSKRMIFEGEEIRQVILDENGNAGALLLRTGLERQGEYSIWQYRFDADRAVHWLESGVQDQFGNSLAIDGNNMRYLAMRRAFSYSVHKREAVIASEQQKSSSVNIWRYTDEFETSPSLLSPSVKDYKYLQAISVIGENRAVSCSSDTVTLELRGVSESAEFPYVLAVSFVNGNEGYRIPKERPNIYLIDQRNGKLTCIGRQVIRGFPEFSPTGRFIFWYDGELRAYFTYDISTGRTVNISKGIGQKIFSEHNDYPATPGAYGRGYWLDKDRKLFIYDRFDIWKVDPTGQRNPVNLTAGYGRKHNICFRNVYVKSELNVYQGVQMQEDDSLMLCAFNERTKENGFFKVNANTPGEPRKLIMDDYFMYFSEPYCGTDFRNPLLKAANENVFMFTRCRANKYPNYYVTTTFNDLYSMTDFRPQVQVNWLSGELWHWTTFAGKMGDAILYKPSDFDSTKKYPVIIYFYERLTQELNLFRDPDPFPGSINIPWFVSRDYIVLCPDIWYPPGDPGAGIYDYVVSAAQSLKRKRWIDAAHIGIQGHSWGGFEVNYLVTRTKVFAAACGAAGISDMASLENLQGFSACSGPAFVEEATNRMAGALPDRVQQYIKNSPVFLAGKVNTPLLLMHNPNDRNVPWEQSVEYFTMLRRLGKQAWLLEYPNSTHTLNAADSWDYTRRLTEFFGHFLKGQPAPTWFTK